MRHRVVLLLVFVTINYGCTTETPQNNATTCVSSSLVAQCPPGSNPILGATADSLCEAAAQGDLMNAEGAISGRCYGEQSCRVACQFSSPCRCGVASVTSDGVVCVDCDTVSACGDGICADGETVQSCEIDCGAVCTPGDMRCNGDAIESCNNNGRYDTLACPSGEVCIESAPGQVNCQRDDILDLDMGDPGDLGQDSDPDNIIANGRIVLADAPWPGTAPNTRPSPAPSPTSRQNLFRHRQLGSTNARMFFTATPDQMWVCANETCDLSQGWTNPPNAEDFCAAFEACGEAPFDCLMGEQGFGLNYPQVTEHGGAAALSCFYDFMQTPSCQETNDIWQAAGCRTLPSQNTLHLPGFEVRATSPNGRYLIVTTNNQGTLQVDLQTQEVTLIDARRFLSANVNNQGHTMIYGLPDVTPPVFGVWRPTDTAATFEILAPQGLSNSHRIIQSALSPNGEVGAFAMTDTNNQSLPVTVLYNLSTQQEILRMPNTSAPINFSTTNHIFATRFVPGERLELWDLSTYTRTHEFNLSEQAQIAFSPAGDLVAILSNDRLQLWSLTNNMLVTEDTFDDAQTNPITNRTEVPTQLLFSPQGDALLIGDSTRKLFGLWRAAP